MGNKYRQEAGYRSGNNRQDQTVFIPKNEEQRKARDLIRSHDIVFLIGQAGTGKSHVAVATALDLMEQNRQYDKLVLVRPMVESGERMGFLPGKMGEKYQPWIAPIYDVLQSMGVKSIEKFMQDKIEICPLAYMRGRSFNRKIAILDEGQNCTLKQLKMFLSRIGKGCKLILTGDPEQSDIPGDSWLDKLADALDGLSITVEGRLYRIGSIELEEAVRHPLITPMLDRIYDLEFGDSDDD